VDEAMTISLVEPNVAAVFSPWTDLPPLESSTPVLRRANRLRTSLIPSLLEARRNNEAIGNPRIELFEIARVYLPAKTGLPDERLMLGITSGGDFLAVKGLIDATVEVADFEHSLFKTARACELKAAGKRIGFLGEVSTAALKSFELRQPTTVAELEIAALESLFQPVPRAAELSMYPAVSRDLNLVVPEQIRWDKLTATVRSAAGSALETIEFRDTYRDAKRLGTGKKSQLFTIVLRRNDATLTNVEADQVRDQIVAACQREHAAELRA
jgi:phenylalanyl-tRNA synthetase beta chain